MIDKQDSLEGIREKLLAIMNCETDVECPDLDNPCAECRARQVLDLPVSSGGVCPECHSAGFLTVSEIRGHSAGLHNESCPTCNGTGQKIVTKELREIIKEWEEK